MSHENCSEDPNKPSVNETSIECCELTGANCVVTSEYNGYFKIGKGKTLTYVITTIAKFVKKLSERISVLEELNDYESYEALLTQTGVTAPTEVGTVAVNNLSGPIVYSYTLSGRYVGTLVGAFPAGRTYIYLGTSNLEWGEKVRAYRIDDDSFAIESGSTTDYVDDDVITNLPIKIKITNA